MFTGDGDFLFTHDLTWITEEEFDRNNSITNSSVLWDHTLLDTYNESFGLTSTISKHKRLKYFDESEHTGGGERVDLFNSNIIRTYEYQQPISAFSTPSNTQFPCFSGFRNDVYNHKFDSHYPCSMFPQCGDSIPHAFNSEISGNNTTPTHMSRTNYATTAFSALKNYRLLETSK